MIMTVEESNGIRRIILDGRLDAKGAGEIEVAFTASAAQQKRVAVDLSAVDYVASIGIRLLVLAGKTIVRNGGKMVLFGASEPVTKVLTAAGLTEIVSLLGDQEAAFASLA